MKKIYFFVFFIYSLFNCYGQDSPIYFSHLTRENGLSNSTIQTIVQDSKGFIWIGTDNGLNKYDGYQFYIYRKENSQRKISGNVIYHMIVDSRQRMWVINSYGISLYNEKLDTFIDKHRAVVNSNVNFIYESQEGKILATTDNGILVYDENEAEFVRLNADNNSILQTEKIKCLYQDSKGNYWLGTKGKGIYIYSNQFKLLKHLQKDGEKKISGNTVSCITGDKNGSIWIGYLGNGLDYISESGDLSYNYRNVQSDSHTLPSNVITCITIDSKNNVWVGSENGGLSLFNRNTLKFKNYKNEIDNPNSISQQTVSCVFEDNQSNIWVGTHRGGVNVTSDLKNTFRFYTQGIGERFLSFKDVKYFFELSNGDILIGTDGGGLNIWNQKTKTFKYYMNDPQNHNSISSNSVLCGIEDKNKNIWLGTWGGGLNKLDRKNGHFTRFIHNENDSSSISSDNIWKILEDGEKLWIGTYMGGVSIYDMKTNIFKRFTYGKTQDFDKYGRNITDIDKDKEGNIWIASIDGGLNCFNTSKQTNESYFINYRDHQLISIPINSIFNCSNGDLWVSTVSGLYKFDFQRRKFILFDNNKYLSSIVSINEDNYGNLWCGSKEGLLRINKLTKKMHVYTNEDGLQGMDFNLNASLKLKSGKLLFGGYNGFNIFDPADVTIRDTPSKIYITNFSILNNSISPSTHKNSILKEQLFDKGSIRLNHSQASLFTFEFATLNFISTNKNEYAYKLEGFDNHWNNIGTQRRVTFTNLDPGDYKLLIRGSNNDGIWNMQGVKIGIKILPPFWKTVWFISLLFVFFLSIIFIYFRMYKNLITRRIHERKQEEVYNMKLDFFTHISHEFRTPLTLISGIAESLSISGANLKEKSQYNILLKNVNRLSYLITELMWFRKTETGVIKLKVSEAIFEDTITQIAEDFIPFAESKKIQYSIECNESGEQCWFDKNIIEKIVLNLLNNSFKYCDYNASISISILPTGHPVKSSYKHSVSFSNTNNKLDYKYFIIKDNGIGIPADSIQMIFDRYYRMPSTQIGSGIGLALVKSLTLLHKGHLIFSSEENKGTEIIIGIPYKKNNYAETEISENMMEINHHDIEYRNHKVVIENDYAVQHDITDTIKHSDAPLILIVDDNSDLRHLLKEHLQNDYLIEEATNGEEGLKKVEETNPSLIITDLMMPKMDGLEMCRILKQDKTKKHIPIIMLTAKDGYNAQLEGLTTGADYYFTKPLSIKLLIITINNIFDRNKSIKLYYLKDYQTEIRDEIHNAKDRELIDTILLLLEDHLEDVDLNVEFLCRHIGMSQSKLYKKIKNITGKSINEFIRSTRLKKALFIMTNEDVNINEVMARIGIESPSYFTKVFTKEVGKTPSQYMKEIKENLN